MKIINNYLKTIVFLNKNKIKNINFEDIDELEDYFKDLFLKLKYLSDISLNGFYIINIYLDHYYGAIIEIKREELEYIEYYDNQIDMKIIVHDITVLYKIEDIFSIPNGLQDKIIIYRYKNKWYIELKKELSDINLANLLENSELIYKTEDIIRYGKKLLKI